MSMSLMERTAALRMAQGDPSPDDPAIRAEAARLAKIQLAQVVTDRPTVVMFAVITVGCAIAALVFSAWLWLTAACFVTILALLVVQRRRAEQRWQRLRVVDPAA